MSHLLPVSSPGIGVLLWLNSNKSLNVLLIYAPIMASDDDEVEEFYDRLKSILTVKSTYTVVIGDFNTKRGRGGKAEENYIDRSDTDELNDKGGDRKQGNDKATMDRQTN